MAKAFVWRPVGGAGSGIYEKVDPGAASGATGRPTVPGASSSKAPGATAEPCPLGTIRVTVKRSDNDEGLKNVSVSIGTQAKLTSGSGEVAFEKIPPGPYTISVTLPEAAGTGFVAPPSCPVVVETSSTSSVTILVEPLGVAKIKVKDQESGKGIRAARVVLTNANKDTAEGVTDGDGVATIAGIRGGNYNIDVTMDAADNRRYRRPTPKPNVAFKPGQTTSVEVEAFPLGVLVVTLQRKPPTGSKAAKKPIGNVVVRLTPAHGEASTGTTDPGSGACTIDGIRPGDYTLDLDFGAEAGKYEAWQPEKLTLKGPSNPEKRIELELRSCQLTSITIKEFIGENDDDGVPEVKAGRVFQVLKTGGTKNDKAIQIKDGELLKLVAPRQDDLFKAPPSLASLPFNPPTSSFKKGAAPSWLEIELAGAAHAKPPATSPDHPVLVVQRGNTDRVVDTKGVLASGRFAIWGPDFPWVLNKPTGKGRWLKEAGNQVAELLNGVTKRSIAPSYWDVFTTHCDAEGEVVNDRTPLAVFPGDRYKLAIKIPPLLGWSHGVSGDYIDGKTIKESHKTTGLAQDKESREESTSAAGTETKVTADGTETTTGTDGTVTVDNRSVFASTFEGEYEDTPAVAFTRNGQRNELGSDVLTGILFAATEAAKWFSDLGNLKPSWGWWAEVKISLLQVSIDTEWGWMAKPKVNDVDWLYVVKLSGTLIEIKFTLKAGLEGTVVPSLVYFTAIVYLEVSGDAKADWTWTSDQRPSEKLVSSTAGLELGVQLVIGNANFCEAKAWVKVPYTFQWKVIPADLSATPPRDDWGVDFKHGCKDGIYVVARYKLFYGKYSGTKKVYLKDKVDLD